MGASSTLFWIALQSGGVDRIFPGLPGSAPGLNGRASGSGIIPDQEFEEASTLQQSEIAAKKERSSFSLVEVEEDQMSRSGFERRLTLFCITETAW
jgi:hypothetical protein